MKTFEAGKTISELGIDTTRKFVVVNGSEAWFEKGEILTLVEDDDTAYPEFRNKVGESWHIFLCDLAYYEENKYDTLIEKQVKKIEEKIEFQEIEEMKEGDYVYVSKESIKEKKAIVNDICDIIDDEFEKLQKEAAPYIPCIYEYRRRMNDRISFRYFR